MWSVIGLMSGTSADGIDLAELQTDGHKICRTGPATIFPYRPETRKAVLSAIANGPEKRQTWHEVAAALTEDHVSAVQHFIAEHALAPDLIVFHGQTVWHDPANSETVQLGHPQTLADETGVPVVADVRQADVEAGGQGAPLVPVYHQALASELEQPVCFLNIGGVANLTYLDADTVIAFDIGPGNALLDDWIRQNDAGECDEGGVISSQGTVYTERVTEALQHPFFSLSWPKSLDRNAFDLSIVEGCSVQDGAATLVAFTVRAIAQTEQSLPKVPVKWIVCGGGRLNPTLMSGLGRSLSGTVIAAEEAGLDGDGMEAQAMAFLGARFMAGLPTSFPETTGVREPVIGGGLYKPAQTSVAYEND